MSVPGPQDPAAATENTKSSWGPELSVGGMLALGLGVLFGGSAILAGAKAAVDPPKLGPTDALDFGWIFLATLPLSAGTAIFAWVLGHQARTQQQIVGGVAVFVLGAVCIVGGLTISAWFVEAGVKATIDDLLGYVPAPGDNVTPPAEWPGWVEAIWAGNAGTPYGIIGRGLEVYLGAFGPVLTAASLMVGAYAGWCLSKVSAES